MLNQCMLRENGKNAFRSGAARQSSSTGDPELFYPVMNQPMIIVVRRPISANPRLNFNPVFLLLLCESIF